MALIMVVLLRRLSFFAAFLIAALAIALPAAAAPTGTPAWTIRTLEVYEGPGTAYDLVGDIEEAVHLRVERCTYRWCAVRSGHTRGWVWRDDLSFGQFPRGPLSGPKLNYKSGGPGQVCFYEGRNFTGDSFCVGQGNVVHDLLLFHRDNRVSSVKIEGNVSVTLCRDRDFSSYCERVNTSEPRLPGFLDNAVSSYKVH